MLDRQSEELCRLSTKYTDDSYEACQDFSRQVAILNGLVAAVYGEVVACSKEIESISEIAESWKLYLASLDKILKRVKGLKDQFPDCGAPELYNHILDYRIAAKERMDHAVEEGMCPNTPAELFPTPK